MTPLLLLFGGAFLAFALVTGMAGTALVQGPWRWVAGAGAALGWIGLQGLLNGLRVRRTMPKLRALSAAVAEHVATFSGGSLAGALEGRRPVLVQFFSERDARSLRAAAMMPGVAQALGTRAAVGRVDIDAHPELAAEHSIARLPTLVLFVDGVERDRIAGEASPARIRRMLQASL